MTDSGYEGGIFWLEDWQGDAMGGIYWRGFDLVEFIKKVEKEKGKVVGIRFDDSYNIEFIIARKEDEKHGGEE